MRQNFYRVIAIAATLHMTGCASIGKFERMSPGERAHFVCSRENKIKTLQSSEEGYISKVNDARALLSRGYRVHTQCEDVKVETPGDIWCTTSGSGSSSYTNCTQDRQVKKERRCIETPVSLNFDLEKQNLQRYESAARAANKEKIDAYRNCHAYVSGMSAREAYRYYNQ